jgi:KDO2-lipid IV(A) lauroyltransferase
MRAEALLVGSLLKLLGALPPAAASNLAGGVAARLGPLLPVSRVAHANLRRALPALDAAGRRRVVRGAWEQLGRTAGEFPHMARLAQNAGPGPGWEVDGEHVLHDLASRGGPAIFFSGHIGNWEILPRASEKYGMPCASLYRAADNTLIDALIARLRRSETGAELKLFAKGARGARQAMMHLRRGGYLAMLVDQKLNDGVQASFFGLPAMTAPAVASFALHFRCPVVPALAKRIGPARLKLIVEPPLALPDSGNRAADILALTQTINDVLERWIRAAPESWLWMHRRWPKEEESSFLKKRSKKLLPI